MVSFESIVGLADRMVIAITPALNKIAAALVIIFAGFIIGKIVGRFLYKVLKDVQADETGKKFFKRDVSISKGVSAAASYLIYLVALVMGLGALGLTTVVLNAVIIIVLVLLGISFLLAIKDFMPNLSAGIMIRQKGLFKEGDTVKLGSTEGVVEDLSLTETRLRRSNGDLLIIPNNLFPKKELIVKRKKRK